MTEKTETTPVENEAWLAETMTDKDAIILADIHIIILETKQLLAALEEKITDLDNNAKYPGMQETHYDIGQERNRLVDSELTPLRQKIEILRGRLSAPNVQSFLETFPDVGGKIFDFLSSAEKQSSKINY